MPRQKAKQSVDPNYEEGRRACKAGYSIKEAPEKQPPDGGPLKCTRRSKWIDGYYDQFFGEKYEPSDKIIPTRIWPVHL